MRNLSSEYHSFKVMDMKAKQAEYYDSYMVHCPAHWEHIRLVLYKHWSELLKTFNVYVFLVFGSGPLLTQDARATLHTPLTGKTGSIAILRSVKVKPLT